MVEEEREGLRRIEEKLRQATILESEDKMGEKEQEWLDFSDPEEGRNAIDQLERAEEKLMIEYKNSMREKKELSRITSLAPRVDVAKVARKSDYANIAY